MNSKFGHIFDGFYSRGLLARRAPFAAPPSRHRAHLGSKAASPLASARRSLARLPSMAMPKPPGGLFELRWRCACLLERRCSPLASSGELGWRQPRRLDRRLRRPSLGTPATRAATTAQQYRTPRPGDDRRRPSIPLVCGSWEDEAPRRTGWPPPPRGRVPQTTRPAHSSPTSPLSRRHSVHQQYVKVSGANHAVHLHPLVGRSPLPPRRL